VDILKIMGFSRKHETESKNVLFHLFLVSLSLVNINDILVC